MKEVSVYRIKQTPRMKRGKRTYVEQSEHLSHKSATVPRRQRALAVRRGTYNLDDRSARRGLDDHYCPISLHLRRGGC